MLGSSIVCGCQQTKSNNKQKIYFLKEKRKKKNPDQMKINVNNNKNSFPK